MYVTRKINTTPSKAATVSCSQCKVMAMKTRRKMKTEITPAVLQSGLAN